MSALLFDSSTSAVLMAVGTNAVLMAATPTKHGCLFAH